MSSELERQVVAALIMRPALIDASDGISTQIFSSDTYKRIFSAIAAGRENGRPEKMDEVLLGEVGGISAAEVSRITSGCYCPIPENFALWVSRLRQQQAGKRLLRLSLAEAEALVKVGEVDPAKMQEIREAWREIEDFEAGRDCTQIRFARRKCSEIDDKPIRYAWKDIIPLQLTMAITGPPGGGKTLVAADASARISCGAAFPAYHDGEQTQPIKGKVLYISSEGVPESILRPRLQAAGADLSCIDIIEGTLTKKKELAIFDITRHLPDLRREVEKDAEIRLVVIDPIASFMPTSINDRAQNQVRQAMDLVSAFADKTGVAVVVCMHFNKDSSQRAVDRTSGSAQYMAAVKSSWSVVHQKGDPANRRLLVPQKSNIAATDNCGLAPTLYTRRTTKPVVISH